MNKLFLLFLCGFLCLLNMAGLSQSSVLATGTWHKFSVTHESIYRISYDQLKSAGLDVDAIDPRTLKLYASDVGMLPKANSAPRRKDLIEMAIFVAGEDDGKFDPTDYVLFYGQGPDCYAYNLRNQTFDYQNNLYTDKNYYFLTTQSGSGKRITTQPSIVGDLPVVDAFTDFAFWETEQRNILNSGSHWFGEFFDGNKTVTVKFSFQGILPDTPVKFISQVMGQSYAACSFNLFCNDKQFYTQAVDVIPDPTKAWPFQYSLKGRIVNDTISLNSTEMNLPQAAQEIKYQFLPAANTYSLAYLDFFLFSFERVLSQYTEQTFFTSPQSLRQAQSAFRIANATERHIVWDVTDPFQVQRPTVIMDNGQLTFKTNTDVLKRFVSFLSDENIKAPQFEKKVANQNLTQVGDMDLLIISPPEFLTEANRLADFKNANNLRAAVATTEQIYNEYSGGKQDVSALRDFIRSIYKKSNSRLQNVLMFGRGSYDYKNRIQNNTNFVPVYESEESLDPVATYSSDDFFVMLEDNQGEWKENPVQPDLMSIGIGRLPIKNLQEAAQTVDKIIDYQSAKSRFGDWRTSLIFLADDGDVNLHTGHADRLARKVDEAKKEWKVTRLFLDNYKQTRTNTSQSAPELYEDVIRRINLGAAIVNFSGHGNERRFTAENILDGALIDRLENKNRYPLFITATCDFGRNDDPSLISNGEKIVTQAGKGAIGLVGSGRPVLSSNNLDINTAFYDALFEMKDGKYKDMGSVFKDMKNKAIRGVSNRNYMYLGDPSIRLPFPNEKIAVTEIKTKDGSQTLQALQEFTVSGALPKEANGRAIVTLFDRPIDVATKGDEDGNIYRYSESSSVLYQGNVEVKQGKFQFIMILPKAYADKKSPSAVFDNLKLNVYAETGEEDFAGYEIRPPISGVNLDAPSDTTPPLIQPYLNGPEFVNGASIGENARLIVILSDKSGINLSAFDPRLRLRAVLDNSQVFPLTFYYQADTQTYASGRISFPLLDLSQGAHTLKIIAADTYGNIAEEIISFMVTDGIGVGNLVAYPNPFRERITFAFTNNLVGDDLSIVLQVSDILGQRVMDKTVTVEQSPYQITLADWDGTRQSGERLAAGTYIVRVKVLSLNKKTTGENHTRVVLTN